MESREPDERRKNAFFATCEGFSPEQMVEYYVLRTDYNERHLIQQFIRKKSDDCPDYLARIQTHLQSNPDLLGKWNKLRERDSGIADQEK